MKGNERAFKTLCIFFFLLIFCVFLFILLLNFPSCSSFSVADRSVLSLDLPLLL